MSKPFFQNDQVFSIELFTCQHNIFISPLSQLRLKRAPKPIPYSSSIISSSSSLLHEYRSPHSFREKFISSKNNFNLQLNTYRIIDSENDIKTFVNDGTLRQSLLNRNHFKYSLSKHNTLLKNYQSPSKIIFFSKQIKDSIFPLCLKIAFPPTDCLSNIEDCFKNNNCK